MNQHKEDESLTLLTPAPEEKLHDWLAEFYGKRVQIADRQLLRHRDLSCVERLVFTDALPSSLIYKQVLPPWDIEQDLHERILIPSISNSAQLFLSAHHGPLTALFLEDLGTDFLEDHASAEVAARMGEELAKLHRAYCYRTEELKHTNVLRSVFPCDYESFAVSMLSLAREWDVISKSDADQVKQLTALIARKLSNEQTSLVHGDLYAENILLRGGRMFIIDWSWFTILGVPLVDLATISMAHHKNGRFFDFSEDLIEAYCFESGRDTASVRELLPFAETLSRIFFLHWLIERRSRGITGTTVGHVDTLIPKIVKELNERHLALKP